MKQLQTVDARFRREGGISVRHNIVMQRVTPNSCTKLIRPACLKPALQCGCTQSLDCCSAKTNHRLKEKLTDSLIAMKGLVVALLPAVALGQLLAGGIVDTTVGPKYEPVVFAVSKINEQLAATNAGQTPVDLLEVVKARTQVVAGQKLYLTLHMSEGYYCNVTVWFRAWLDGPDRLLVVEGPTCTKHQPSARALGSVSDPKPLASAENVVLRALNFAVCAANDRSNNMFAAVLGDTSGATYTEQLTAGMTYRFFNVPLVDSQCRKQGLCADMDLYSCAADVSGMRTKCDFVVQVQLWMNPPFTLSKMTC